MLLTGFCCASFGRQLSCKNSTAISISRQSKRQLNPFPGRYRRGIVSATVAGNASSSNNEDDNSEDSNLESNFPPPRSEAEASRSQRRNDLLERLDRISAYEKVSTEQTQQSYNGYLSSGSQLIYLTSQFPKKACQDVEKYLKSPARLLVAASIAILFGNFCATSATTIIGSVADWDPLAAAVLLVLVESFTKYYFRTPNKSVLLRLANAFKVGLIFGMIADAFKLST